ncbi:MarR family winged helix-turn-helix transcriptional regulator [Pseudomonas sp. efr-133-TYG-103a]|uniref:MarR family winged helix-turn-helix transcriptional regulator n=1 Tax=Pseudomonas sp. efr-133-TYG-103a TaxID=3040308 RepID=UPI0025554788|nr:MarR family winged helix-turn-helix transcriptional regulator [Pseudomonas sp. efr-133-TYG-103a]
MNDRQKRSVAIPEGLNIPPQATCHATYLRKATRRITLLYDALLAPSGLRSTQRSILMQIARCEVASMSELAALLLIDRSALAQNLKPLEREGWVQVQVDSADKRSRLVSLTRAGMDKLLETQPLWQQAQASFEKTYGAERAVALRQALIDVAAGEYEGADPV